MRVVVLGGGLAGLSAAWHLASAGHRVELFERGPEVGGLARSLVREGFTLDLGPHRLHTRDPELERHLLEVTGGRLVRRDRRSRILLRGRLFDYPLRAGNVLAKLPPGLLARASLDWAVAQVAGRRGHFDERNFEGWVVRRFGRTLYREFFGTYTEKAWGLPCRELSSDWAAQRISQRGLVDAARRALFPWLAEPEGTARGPVREFWYPEQGGIGELARCYARQVEERGGRVRTGASVERVDLVRGRAVRVATTDGCELEADHVVSTIPLPALLRKLREGGRAVLTPAEREAAAGLKYLAIAFVYVAVDRPGVMPDHWMYLPDPSLTVHRLSEFRNFSPDAAPEGSTAVCCELTCRAGDERWNLDDSELGRLALRDLTRIGLLAPDEGRVLEVLRVRHAYPVYDHAYRERLELLRAAVRRVENLSTTGRQGLFRYNNMDHSIAMGRKVARALESAVPGPAEPPSALPAEAAEEPALGAEHLG